MLVFFLTGMECTLYIHACIPLMMCGSAFAWRNKIKVDYYFDAASRNTNREYRTKAIVVFMHERRA